MRQLWVRTWAGDILALNYDEGHFALLRGFTADALDFLRDINQQVAAIGASADSHRRPGTQLATDEASHRVP